MGLYERLLGIELPKIPIHQFQSIVAEYARGRITGTQANDLIEEMTGVRLDAGAAIEIQTLVDTFPVGTTALITANRAIRTHEVDQVLLLADKKLAGYNTAALLKTRLGV
jgi:hypothetical protein